MSHCPCLDISGAKAPASLKHPPAWQDMPAECYISGAKAPASLKRGSALLPLRAVFNISGAKAPASLKPGGESIETFRQR